MNTEEQFQNLLTKFLKCETKIVLKEVPYKRKKIDIVEVLNGEINCIEVKLRNWKKAIDQASINSLFCQKSYIAMPKENINNIKLETLEKLNIGLISIDKNGYNIERDVKQNKNLINRYYKIFKENINRCLYESKSLCK